MIPEIRELKTDLLIVGGGMAGMTAAIKAREQGLDVTLTDKGYVGKAGQTHFAEGDLVSFRADEGDDLGEWMKSFGPRGEYLNNRDWDEILLLESKTTYEELDSWGVEFVRRDDGRLYTNSGEFLGTSSGGYRNISMAHRKFAPRLRAKAEEIGVRVLDNVLIADLVKSEGRIAGAFGLHIVSGVLYRFRTAAVIIAAGSAGFSVEAQPRHYATGDGDAVGYRVGAVVSGKEFNSQGSAAYAPRLAGLQSQKPQVDRSGYTFDGFARFPAFRGDDLALKAPPSLNAEGGPVYYADWEAHLGRAPLYYDLDSWSEAQLDWALEFQRRVGTAEADKIGLDLNKRGLIEFSSRKQWTWQPVIGGSGLWPSDKDCATNVPGLWAAGNSCATMGSGVNYAGMGFGLNHAAVTGRRAALAAATYVQELGEIVPDPTEVEHVQSIVCAPLERRGGFSPAWAMQTLQGLVIPYFVLGVKHGGRLESALTLVDFMNRDIVPKLRARDVHEWRRAQETRNMCLHAETVLRASLYRAETRGSHIREDYPLRDDPRWLVWVQIREDHGEMTLSEEPVPREWWPDLSLSHDERYPAAFPLA